MNIQDKTFVSHHMFGCVWGLKSNEMSWIRNVFQIKKLTMSVTFMPQLLKLCMLKDGEDRDDFNEWYINFVSV